MGLGRLGTRRLTPAGAGRTGGVPRAGGHLWAYPRRCGENDAAWSNARQIVGLPPQVRGERRRGLGGRGGAGLTPAGAGRTWAWVAASLPLAAYPRRCGENDAVLQLLECVSGLPPQVRGELGLSAPVAPCTGLTPAGAGRTMLFFSSWSVFWAYPRRCGENADSTGTRVQSMGLPPQVRGELSWTELARATGGLTPAGAGRTLVEKLHCHHGPAYPRRCGENAKHLYIEYMQAGLPPQVRGEHRPPTTPAGSSGLTPAGAGRTGNVWYPVTGDRAYPRRCGENNDSPAFRAILAGLPPQVRGEPIVKKPQPGMRRLTPAGAGRTCSC